MKRLLLFLPMLFLLTSAVADDTPIVRRIFVTRHGQPDMKKERKQINKGDPVLSPLGCTQATKLGKYLKSVHFNGKIYASPYVRTVETAVLIGRELNLPVYPEETIQECVSAGKGSPKAMANLKSGGCTLEMLKAAFPGAIAPDAKLKDDWLYTKFEDKKVAHPARMAKSLQGLTGKQKTGDMLLVCHAGTVGALRKVMTAKDQKPLKGSSWNCSLFIYGEKADGSIVPLEFVEPEKYMAPDEITANKVFKKDEDAKKSSMKGKKK